jgi:hypothetical protein
MNQRKLTLGSALLILATTAAMARGGEIGHFAPGAYNIRDFSLPDAGVYWGIYNYGYGTTRLNDANGNQISSLTLTGRNGLSTTVNLDVDISGYALSPFFIWVAPKKVLGAKYGIMVNPTFSNANINGLLSLANRTGRSLSTGQFNISDTYVEPVWLDWGGKHYDVAYGYGFYIPTGVYKVTTVTLPVIGSVQAQSPDNTGYGFWTNQNQGSFYIYPWSDQRLAIENVLTWEIHRKKRNFDLTPGQNLTWTWGISEYLPLTKDQNLLLEAGPMGYSSFQVTDDRGADAVNVGVHDSVSAVGVQVGVTSVKRSMSLNFSWMHEYSAVDRFQGTSFSLNFAAKF